MPNKIQTLFKPFSKITQNHITKRVVNDVYDAKVLLGASIALDAYSNMVDYVQIGNNKKLSKEDRHYLQAYKLTNASVESLVQLGAGALMLNPQTQEYLLKASQKLTGMPVNPGPVVKKNFRILSTLLGAVVVAKRVISPLIVTPLTTMLRKRIDMTDVLDFD